MVVFAPFIGIAAVYAGLATAAPNASMKSPAPSAAYGGSSAEGGAMSSAMATTTALGASSVPCSTSAQSAYSTPAYGSGSGWSGSPYNSCVQQCMASWGAQATTASPTTTTATASAASGMTHTVIVAPTQGVLRYVPFVVNASVGDTIQFMWNANNHTVTKSSQLAICNKTMDAPFASGEQNKSFVFTQMVNSTNTTFYYCATTGHCQKGMFGIINPPNAAMGSNMSLSGMMPAMAANSSSMAAMWNHTQMITQNNTMASTWGGNIDMSGMPEWAHQYVAENVMYSRTFVAANPETLNADGSVNLSTSGSTPLMIPGDITAVANSNSSSSAGSASGAVSPSNSSPSSSGSNPYPTMTNHARKLGSSSIVAGFAAAIVVALAF